MKSFCFSSRLEQPLLSGINVSLDWFYWFPDLKVSLSLSSEDSQTSFKPLLHTGFSYFDVMSSFYHHFDGLLLTFLLTLILFSHQLSLKATCKLFFTGCAPPSSDYDEAPQVSSAGMEIAVQFAGAHPHWADTFVQVMKSTRCLLF